MAKAAAKKSAKTAPVEPKAEREVKLLPKTTVSPQSPKIAAGSIKDGLAQAGATKTSIQLVPLDAIQVIPGFNARRTDTQEHAEKIDSLTKSMLTSGYDPAHPLTGFVGKDGDADVIYVTDGHGRLEAARRANEEGAEIKTVPMVIRPSSTTMRDHTANLIRENSGKELTLAEKAVVVKRLLKLDVDEKELADELNITQRYVDQIIMLINAPQLVRSSVAAGRVSGTEAIRLLTQHRKDPSKAEAAVEKMLANADARGAVKATRKDTEEGTKTGRKAATAEERAEGKRLVPKMETLRTTFGPWTEGQEFPLSDLRPLRGIIDTDWYALTDQEGYAVATEEFKVEVLITRPKKTEPKKTDGEEAPPKKRARRLKDVTSSDEDSEGEGDEGDEVEDDNYAEDESAEDEREPAMADADDL